MAAVSTVRSGTRTGESELAAHCLRTGSVRAVEGRVLAARALSLNQALRGVWKDRLTSTGRFDGQRRDLMMAEPSKPVEVSRRIEAPATHIFRILANPQRHVDFDGSGMLRGAVHYRPI